MTALILKKEATVRACKGLAALISQSRQVVAAAPRVYRVGAR
jgi:hypothetical protein